MEKAIELIEKMAISELKEYRGKGIYGELKFASRSGAKKHHRKERLFARIIKRLKDNLEDKNEQNN